MSNQSNLGSVPLLETVRSLAKEFAAKEATILQAAAQASAAAEQVHRRAVWEADQKLEAITTEADSLFQMAKSELNQRYEARRKRIQRLHQHTVRNLPALVNQARGKWLGQLQAQKNKAQKARDEVLAIANEALEKVTTANAEDSLSWQQCRSRGELALAAFGSIRKAFMAGNLSTTEAGESREAALQAAEALRTASLPKLFQSLPLPAWLGISAIVALFGGILAQSLVVGTVTLLVLAGASLAVFFSAQNQARMLASKLAGALKSGETKTNAILAEANAAHQATTKSASDQYEAVKAKIEEGWNEVDGVEKTFEAKVRAKLEFQVPRVSSKLEDLHMARSKALLEKMDGKGHDKEAKHQATLDKAAKALADANAKVDATQKDALAALQEAWDAQLPGLASQLNTMATEIDRDFEPWTSQSIEGWQAPQQFHPNIPIGAVEAQLPVAGVDRPKHLNSPIGQTLLAPVALGFPSCGSLRIETNGPCAGDAGRILFNTILRLLASFPPGKIAFTILDPIGLGQNFAGLMHLADYEEALIHRRIWTQRSQMEERLTELNEHIEKVIQMYLRNEYATITEYNELAGTTAEKYHFLVMADFPHGLSESGYQRLKSILLSGPRCGVFTLIHRDLRTALPDGLTEDIFNAQAIVLRETNGKITSPPLSEPSKLTFQLELPPPAELELKLIHRIGKASVDSNRVEVPFSTITPSDADVWSAETGIELKVAVGRTGATKFQHLAIGKGTKQHALFAGKTGSGKSTLFHVIITNLALWASPDEVEFYLIDFKKGVEFKCYATHRLPHARVVAIESDRAFGLSVLQRVDEELRRRGDLFRKANVQDLPGYRQAKPQDPMPRTLLLIDEFQEFFTEDDVVSQNAAVLFDRIVRQGRAFGIHVLLGSQTLGGAYTLARTTFGQMVIRVALMCNEADAHLIMDDSNSAPRLLTRPGEGIYNDMAGAVEGNSPFQVVWLADADRDAQLERVARKAASSGKQWAKPIVFEGNAPAEASETTELIDSIQGRTELNGASGRIWLGAPNSIKGPTEVSFRKQSGQHLLVVSQREEASLTMLSLAALALAGQQKSSQCRLLWLDSAAPGSPDEAACQRLAATAGERLEMITAERFGEIFDQLSEELAQRTGASQKPIFVFVPGLQRFKKLRQEDEFSFGGGDSGSSPAAVFSKIITEGPSVGIHLLTAVDTFNNIGRWLSRKALSEFECRVVFQMSANDSASLVDSPAASQLGLHKAMLFHEQQGHSEVFRPFGPPENAWLEEMQPTLS